ncbi:7-dehydrocholesterol reductase [Anaeramoeba flamelloides]|uniref:7-dehydrocholesterol reductase n=1 Tax=Anaeramoeba flamelloides TaxID=1746091 RepID=A0AAV8A3Q8_9EUKA|nr:7-dehydrocholesterol reductase [Anaeramoeba flamelloides]|eukprot:Anaeramoba_flamelloidesa350917_218.p1 GENE.a350917_218~~a350917_218.p1  ORF type:complete len:469 (-),score=77.52 a350917_218:7-1380(-)
MSKNKKATQSQPKKKQPSHARKNQATLLKTLKIIPIVLFSPFAVLFLWEVHYNYQNSFLKYFGDLSQIPKEDLFQTVSQQFLKNFTFRPFVLAIIASYFVIQFIILHLVPGKTIKGPLTRNNAQGIYKDNGFLSYFVSILVYLISAYVLKLFRPVDIYHHFGEILATLSIIGLSFCLFFYLKGRFNPNCNDHGSNGNFIFDYYWGMELHPRIFNTDLKQYINCRIGMVLWALLNIIYLDAQYSLHGHLSDSMLVSVVLQLVYITKFFWWESGYFFTIDIMVDRAGFYICWGCIAYLPLMYTIPSLFLVQSPIELGSAKALAILLFGLSSILLNYWSDQQKQIFRKTKGKCKIFGKEPKILETEYTDKNNQIKKGMLLISGFWGMARHINYLFEICLAFAWSVTGLFSHLFPYIYVIFLTVLLLHRERRDNERCSNKYKKYWIQYCKHVQYRIIPKIF